MQPEASGKRDRSPLANIQLPMLVGIQIVKTAWGGPPERSAMASSSDSSSMVVRYRAFSRRRYLQAGENPGAEKVQRSPAVDVGAVQLHVGGEMQSGSRCARNCRCCN